MMDIIEVIQKRSSTRAYRPEPVEEEKLQLLLESMRMAPTAANRQPFKFIIIHTAGKETELRRIYNAPWFVGAPIIICGCAVPAIAWIRRDGKNYYDVDVAIAMDHLILTAAGLGLGTCWIAAFDPVAAREVLGLPDEVEPIVFTPLGYADAQPGIKKRKPQSELVAYEHW
jgi:nitroreductase